eukprot:gene28336-35107_t
MGIFEDAETGNLAGVKSHIASGQDVDALRDGESVLFCAASGGHRDIVEYLLSKGADANLKDHCGDSPLNRAASFGYPEVVRALLARGSNREHKDSEGYFPLHNAVQAGCIACVKLLLEAGAGPEVREDSMGFMPIHEAAIADKPDLVAALLDGGASPDSQNKRGDTALHVACAKGCKRVIKLLVSRGVMDNLKNHAGATAKETATEDIAEMLSEALTLQ